MLLNRIDLSLALAPFRRRPGTAAIMITLLAVLCALTSANLSVFHFLTTRPLPYANYERILWIGQEGKMQKQPAGDPQTLDNFMLLQAGLTNVERIAAFNRWHNETLRHQDATETVTGCWITPGFFEVLGVKPILGTTFSDPAILGQLADRRPYFATAQALGADRRQILKPLLAEHLLLSALGVAVGAPLALAYRHLLLATLGPAGLMLPTFEVGLFAATGLVATALVVLTVVLGVRTLHGERHGDPVRRVSTRVVGSHSRGWIDGVAILAQTSLAIALLVTCSLLALSLRRQASANADLPLVDLQRGFLVLRKEKYESHSALIRRMLEIKSSVLARPEIRSAALGTDSAPVAPNFYTMIDDLDTVSLKESQKQVVRATVCPDYFATVGLRIISGRGFTAADLHSRRRTMVISQRVAELYWPGRDPIGRRMLINHRTDDWAEIIGVAQNIESPSTNALLPMVWRGFNHHPFDGAEVLFQTRTGQPISREWFQRVVWSVDPTILIPGYDNVSNFLRRQRWLPESIARLSLLLALVASAVCGFGIFSILNRRVSAAQKEIAVRKALGASAWRIISSVGRRDLGWAAAGLALGVTLSLLGGRHVFELANLRASEVVLAPVVGAIGVFAGALLGALVPLVRALAADTALVLRSET